jgi:hypothetical protein
MVNHGNGGVGWGVRTVAQVRRRQRRHARVRAGRVRHGQRVARVQPQHLHHTPSEHAQCTDEAGTEMHPADELLKQEDFRTSWGVERLPPGWYRTEPRRRWSFSSDGDVYDDDDRDSVGSY